MDSCIHRLGLWLTPSVPELTVALARFIARARTMGSIVVELEVSACSVLERMLLILFSLALATNAFIWSTSKWHYY